MVSKHKYLLLLASCFAIYIIGCGFDNPYVPEVVGSSTLTGQIVTEPAIDLTGTEVLLRGQDSFAAVTGADGNSRLP